MNKPSIGDSIYVPTNWYLDYGKDDFLGGVATVSVVVEEDGKTYIGIQERPDWLYHLDFLLKNQDIYRANFGDRKARPDPDLDPESNTGFIPEINKRGNRIERYIFDDRTPEHYRMSLDDGWKEFAGRSKYSGGWFNHEKKHVIVFDSFEEVNIFCDTDEALSSELIAIEAIYGVYHEAEGGLL